jgi:FAD:protein FMN transferase
MSKQFTFEAIGTHFWIEIFDEVSDEELKATKSRLELLSSVFNKQYSRFREDSWISILNRERIFKDPSQEYRAILALGKELYLESEGAFNILIGHILEASGYDTSYSFQVKDNLGTLPVCNPLTDLTITEKEISLSCGNIDIGGYGKGYLIDRMTDDLLAHGITYFLINGGGDMYATSDNNRPISIYLEHPIETGKYLLTTTLLNQGFAASSPFKRQWTHKDKTYTHIIADTEIPPIATFVKADTATTADTFGTVSLLLSEEKLLALVKSKGLAFAKFTPATGQFWQTTNFGAV